MTTATVTGASYGFALLWAIVFSVIATVVLQDMAARLGLITREGLGEALRATFTHPVLRGFVIFLIVAAVGIGGASYAGGDTTGTALGLAALTGLPRPVLTVGVGVVVFAVLATGTYQRLEKLLTVLVLVMSAVFVLTAVLARPDLGELVAGVLVPRIPQGGVLTAIALIGTTVVPYNLFLHANLVQEKWAENTPRALREVRRDNALSFSIGGLITVAIAVTAAATLFARGIEADSVTALADQLRLVLGPAADYVFGVGLFAAGLTSTIAGPLGAAYAIASILGWSTSLASLRFKAIWALVVVLGVAIALTGVEPVTIIVLAQAANGILLPVVAVFLLVVMNRRDLLGQSRNRLLGNILGGVIVLTVTALGCYQLADITGLLPQ